MSECPECGENGRVFLGMDETTVYECPECGNKWERPKNRVNTDHV